MTINAPREKERLVKWSCGECGEHRQIEVSWDWESGEYGSVHSQYPVTAVIGGCPGVVEDHEGTTNWSGMRLATDDECGWCPFSGEDDYGPRDDLQGVLLLWFQARDYERGFCELPRVARPAGS